MKASIHRGAIFAGCAKNCAAALPYVLANIDRMAGLFAESAYIFVENDSKDATKHVLREWCQPRDTARLFTFDGLDASCPVRTVRLAKLRSEYVSLVKSELSDYDYMFVLDCDWVNAAPVHLDAIPRAIQFLEQDPSRAGVFANCDGVYHDMWALRHPTWCPVDVWEEVLEYVLQHHVSDVAAYERTLAKRVTRIPLDAPSRAVDSAFGGLAIYKLGSILRNKRTFVGHKSKVLPTSGGPAEVGWQVCEHVSFHAGLLELGQELFIVPYLVNCRAPTVTFPPSWYRSMAFDLATMAPLRVLSN